MELYDLNIERSLLSAFVFEPELLDTASGLLESTTFYLPFHSKVYSVILDLYTKGKPVDEDFIKRGLGKEFDEVAMIEMLSANPITNIDSYVNLLIELQKKRELTMLSIKLKKQVAQDSKESEEVISNIAKDLEAISAKGVVSSKDTGFYIDAFIESMEAAQNGKSGAINCGLSSVDVKIGGFFPGDLVVVAARPSMGKTALTSTITNNALLAGNGVYFSSLEMSGEKIMRRLLSIKTREKLSDLKKGVVKDLKSFNEGVEYFKKAPLFLDDESYLTIQQIKAKAIRVFRRHKEVKVWIIDHLRYIKKPGQNIANEVSEITKEIKKIAKEYGVVVFLLSQLNRANEQRSDKRPMLSDLRESGAVEEDPEIVLGLHRESYYLRNKVGREPDNAEADIIILKNRDGESGVCKVGFNAPYAEFTNSVYEVAYESDDSLDIPRVL